MTNRLNHFRSQLAGLRRARAGERLVTGWSALAITIIGALFFFAALDWMFELPVPQRIVVLLAAVCLVVWSFRHFTWPLLTPRESELDLALLLERHHRIDSDLVAALQFDDAAGESWGSPQLQNAVVESVSSSASTINVFAGFSTSQMKRRLSLLGGFFLVAAVSAALWPGHIAALANRLLLGSTHYPTRTTIQQLLVNDVPTLTSATFSPTASKCPQGRPLAFLVQCTGQVPLRSSVEICVAKSPSTRTQVTLTPLSLGQRRARLTRALEILAYAMREKAADLSPLWRSEVSSLVRFDAAPALAPLEKAKAYTELPAVTEIVSAVIQNWPDNCARTTLLAGELPRLNDDVTYQVVAGDAWTDPASIQMIPLPIVELRVQCKPPKYAEGVHDQSDPSGRQLSVLEGSSVELQLHSANRKLLRAAWLTASGNQPPQRLSFSQQDQAGLDWSFPQGTSALERIHGDVHYEIQVIDADGLSLEMPIRGTIRVRPDRPPTGLAAVIHKVVLPTAQPVITYRVSDDYGISRLTLAVEVERGMSATGTGPPAADSGPQGSGTTPAASSTDVHRYDVLVPAVPLGSSQMPLVGKYGFALAPLSLTKGDRLKLTLEVSDYRGQNDQQEVAPAIYRCEPLLLEISDEAGVLAAISEADPRSEERLNEIIKGELTIGDSP